MDDFLGGRARKQQNITLADAVQKQATAQKSKALGVPSQVDPFQQLMAELQQQLDNVNVNKYMSPLEMLRQQASSSVSAQYDPQIEALKAEMARTERRGASNQNQARDMYGALSKDIASQQPGIQQMMDQSQAQVAQQYAGAKSEIAKGYDASAAEQQAIMKQLGIQAAMPEVNKEQVADEQYFQNVASQDSRQIHDSLEQIQQGAQQFNQQSANSASMAGTNTVQDLKAQLEDYLMQAGGQMSALTSGKQSGIAAALAQLQGADADRAEKLANQEQDRIMQLADFQLKAREQLGKESESQDIFKGTTGLSGASNFLAQKYPDQPTRASALSSLLAKVLETPELKAGRQTIKDPATGMDTQIPLTEAFVFEKIREAGEGQGFGTADLNNAMDAYLSIVGKLR